MNKILEAHKIQMDMVNDSFDKADFERKERLENAQDRENELQVEFMQEEKLASKALEDTDCHASPDDGCPHCEQLREGI